MDTRKPYLSIALIAFALIGTPAFSQELCKGYSHSRDGEIEAIYKLIINNEVFECSQVRNADYLQCGNKGSFLWGDAISAKLSTGDPIPGSSVILTDAKKQRYRYTSTSYSESALTGLPRFSSDCSFELMYFSPMRLVMPEDPSRHALLVWVRRFNAFLPSSKPSL